MIRKVNASPFTKRLHYTVEEISMEEFQAALATHNQKQLDKKTPNTQVGREIFVK